MRMNEKKYKVTGLNWEETLVLMAGLGNFHVVREGNEVYAVLD